ncbi:thiamine-repressible mitochondrial transport protein THI74-like [Zingiber officinale]|uniref:thiamine-repressible mitochondrial transport protein THI74-like n=1 Tax=Zingiber officinale TaxID=94328 RepID=UPI001C4BEADF|nr:thiamine-repressible mitochondrial transport protein THI74-like [Zingiber officinale]XP_042449596.1 thiamine-repressible mitochondrial transport protein THI74-like [Zingiber officinale]
MRFSRETWRWALGLIYIVAVAIIWIAASYIVQSVVDSGVSPFLITYICNSLFVVLIPIIEISRYLEVILKGSWHWFRNRNVPDSQLSVNSEEVNLLVQTGQHTGPYVLSNNQQENISLIHSRIQDSESILSTHAIAFSGGESCLMTVDSTKQVNTEEHWTRCQVAKVSFLICPFWFFAQLTFNLSLKYTTVTSNTILSSSSSLFTFLVAVAFLGEKFTWVKLVSVLLCMGGTIMVSLSDSSVGLNAIATNPLLGDILALVSAGIYAVYITLIRQKLTDEKKNCQANTAQFLGFLGLFNLLIFFPVLLVLNFTKLEPFHKLSWNQLGLIVGKGLLDNVLSDYLWAEAIHLTTTTVATAGLTIQVPIAAVVDSLTGHAPHLLDYIGAVVVMVGFTGINIPSDDSVLSLVMEEEQETTTIDASSER